MPLLSVETINTSTYGTILDIWEVGGNHRRIKPPFKPYMYSLMQDRRGKAVKKQLLSSLKWRTVWKLQFKNTQLLEQNRSPWTVEDNFPFKQRIAIDVGYNFPSKYPRMLAWDIETKTAGISPNWRRDKIISIATWGDTNNSHKFFYGDTKNVIEEFLAFVKEYNPDILADFYGRFYDIPCLLENCKQLRIKCRLGRDGSQPYIFKKEFERRGKGRIEKTVRINGRLHFDVQKEVDADYTLTLAGLKNRGLKEVARYYGLNPVEIDYNKIAELPVEELRKYNLSDARCTYYIAQIYFRGLYELAVYLQIPLDMIVQRQPSHMGNIVIGRKFKRLGIISDGENKKRFPFFFRGKRSNEGAIVKCYETGVFHNITHKDFNSMYVNIMRAFNLSPETVTLVTVKGYTGKYNFYVRGSTATIEVPDRYHGQVICHVDLSKDSVLRQVLTDIVEQRNKLKKLWKKTGDRQYWSREWALKIVGNSLYGYNIMVHSRYGNVLVGILTAAIGRYLIQQAIEHEQKAGNKVLELDTDGFYYVGDVESNFSASRIFPSQFKTEYLRQSKEKYDGIILIDEKSYILKKGNKLVKHGSGILGRHIPPVIDVFIDELAFALFKKENPTSILQSWNKKRIEQFPVQFFVSNATLSKRPDSYNKTTMYHNLITKLRKAGITPLWGDKIQYVKTLNGYTPTALLKDNDKIDAEYYQKRMCEIASRILKQPFKQLKPFFEGQTRLGGIK